MPLIPFVVFRSDWIPYDLDSITFGAGFVASNNIQFQQIGLDSDSISFDLASIPFDVVVGANDNIHFMQIELDLNSIM